RLRRKQESLWFADSLSVEPISGSPSLLAGNRVAECCLLVNPSVRNSRLAAAYPFRIARCFGTRTRACWNKELHTRVGWSRFDPLRSPWRPCRLSLETTRIPGAIGAIHRGGRDSR